MPEEIKIPAVGSFPGYKLSRSLFITWATMLNQQADIWNATWASLLSGDYKSEHYFGALAQSLKSSTAALEQSLKSIDRRGAPPWNQIRFDPTQQAEITVGQVIDPYDVLSCKFLVSPAASVGAAAPLVSVTQSGAYSAAIAFDDSERPPEGEYLAIVTCQRYTEPLAVVTVSVPSLAAKQPSRTPSSTKKVAPARSDPKKKSRKPKAAKPAPAAKSARAGH